MNKRKTSGAVLTALFAALISAGSFIQIPLPGGVPIVIQDMMALLSGLLLGPVYGTAAVLVFCVLGCIGLPVFSGSAGLQVIIAGPTGGFLVGYLLSALVGGFLLTVLLPRTGKHHASREYVSITAASFIGMVVLFVCGIIGFIRITHFDMAKTLLAVLIPFIPGNIIKLVLAVFLTKKFRPIVSSYLN